MSRTGLGLFLAWGCSVATLLAVVSFDPLLGKARMIVSIAALVVFAMASLWYIVAFIMTLVRRQWKKAVVVFILGYVGANLLLVGFSLALAFNFMVGAAIWKQEDEKPRLVEVPGEDGKVAFSVEYINAHPFLAEYDKTIVFKSGKRIGVCVDTGGAGPFAVYRIGADEYYLVDGLNHTFLRNDYRVNTEKETVEMMVGDYMFWVRIPDGTLAVVGGGSESISVKTADEENKDVNGGLTAVGDSLACRCYLGLVSPSGEFEASPDGKDPYADIIEPQWKAVDARAANLPFVLEWRDRDGCNKSWRITSATGKHFGLYFIGEFKTCDISVGAAGVYWIHFVSKNGRVSDWFDNEYRIDVNNERVEMFIDKWLVSIPPGTVDIPCFRQNEGRADLTAICEDGTKIESNTSILASEDKYQYVPLGYVDIKGVFHPFSPESGAVKNVAITNTNFQ